MTTHRDNEVELAARARGILLRRRADAEILGGSTEIDVTEIDEVLAALRTTPVDTVDGDIDAGLEAILAKDDTEIMLDELRDLFGADLDVDSRFTVAQVITAMERSFENGKAHIEMVNRATVEAATRLNRATVDGDAEWLVRQLEAWPTRIDPNKTTNIEYLMKAAATRLNRGSDDVAMREALKQCCAYVREAIDDGALDSIVALDAIDAVCCQALATTGAK